jgi:nucleotide sugar dehydrogenase
VDVVVIGCGYVGLVTGVCFASLGHDVLAIEIDEKRADLIRSGIPPFHEPGLEELLQKALAEGRLRIGNDINDSLHGDVIFLCVQTPQGSDGSLNTDFLVAAARQLGDVLRGDPRRRVVVVRSTVTPGTTEDVVGPALGDGGSVAVCANPEFLREGSAVADFMEPDRVVVGGRRSWAIDMVADLYAPLNVPVIRTAPSAAELAKCTSNALLATLISFSNQIARIAEHVPGVDVEDVLDIIHRDRRLSPVVDGETISPGILTYLKSGCGFGGSCLPKDLSALIRYAASVGEPASILEGAKATNDAQPERLVAAAGRLSGGLQGKAVTVLGLAFKAGTDDLRESPGIRIVELLLAEGASVTAYDPLVSAAAVAPLSERGMKISSDLRAALSDADLCVVTTLDAEFEGLHESLSGADGGPLVVDGRRLLDPDRFDEDRFVAVGRHPRSSAGRPAGERG